MKLKFAIATAALLSASTAYAAPVNLTYNGPVIGPYESVTVTTTPVPVIGGNTVAAGAFDMTQTGGGGLGDFFAWCLDLGAYLGTTGNYEITTTPFQNGGVDLMQAGIDRISAVFNANFSADVTSGTVKSAAFQLALWETVYDTDFNIATGAFQAASGNSDVNTAAEGYLTAAKTYLDDDGGPDMWSVLFLESTDGGVDGDRQQNLVTVAPVPLPASVLMLLAALGAMGVTARRRQTA